MLPNGSDGSNQVLHEPQGNIINLHCEIPSVTTYKSFVNFDDTVL